MPMEAKEYYDLFIQRYKQIDELRKLKENERLQFMRQPITTELRDSTLDFIAHFDEKENSCSDLYDMKFNVLQFLLKCYRETTLPDVKQATKRIDDVGLYIISFCEYGELSGCYKVRNMYFMIPLCMCLYDYGYEDAIPYIHDKYGAMSKEYSSSLICMILYMVYGVNVDILRRFHHVEMYTRELWKRHLFTVDIMCNRYYYEDLYSAYGKLPIPDRNIRMACVDVAKALIPHLPESDNKFKDEIITQFLDSLKNPC